jgi:para-nitrobenzyl esterase
MCTASSASPVPRPSPGPLGTPDGVGTSEDCLVLNVWSPDLSGSAPVMVWFHGGGYAVGTASSPLYEGTNLAGRNDIVMVSVNHRLGLLGFLDVSRRLGDGYEASSNAGMLDLVAALEWVQENIAAFGGDPGCVTIFGESGGGGKVSALLAMPSAAGLFHRAIIQSGPPFQFPDPDQAHDTCGKVLAELGLAGDQAHQLLELPAERLLEVQIALGAGGGPSPGGMSFAPTVGTDALPDWPGPSVRAGAAAEVPLLIGTNEHEAWFMTLMDPRLKDGGGGPELSDDELAERLAPGVDGGLDELIAHYKGRFPERSNFQILLTVESEAFRVRSLRLADHKVSGGGAPVFTYLFRRTASKLAHAGSYHGLEMGFMFDNLHTMRFTLADEGSEQLAREMSGRWAAFARTGRSDMDGLPSWTAYDLDRRATMEIDRGWRMVDDPLGDDRRAWDPVPLGPRTRPWSGVFG